METYHVPEVLAQDIDKKFGLLSDPNEDTWREVTLYAHHLTTIILESVRPERGHGARKKRIYNAVEARMFAIQKDWAIREGYKLTDLMSVTGAWEIASGDDDGLFRENFDAAPEGLRPLLMRMGRCFIVPSCETNALMLRAMEDWTMMDRYDESSRACYDQLPLIKISER